MAGESILIVDDNEMNRRLLHLLLDREGYRLRSAAGGAEARALVRELRPALVLMDVQLPDVDGLQLTREIKGDAELRSTLVIALTSYAMKGDREKALAAGCDDYVTKPIDTRSLPAVIAEHLRRGHPQGPSFPALE